MDPSTCLHLYLRPHPLHTAQVVSTSCDAKVVGVERRPGGIYSREPPPEFYDPVRWAARKEREAEGRAAAELEAGVKLQLEQCELQLQVLYVVLVVPYVVLVVPYVVPCELQLVVQCRFFIGGSGTSMRCC